MYLKSFDLKNKIALVTGAGKGIGRASAIALAEAGADLIILSRTESDLKKVEKEIKKLKKSPESDGLINDGNILIAAITSCTNTSNPSVILGAGLLAKRAIEKGLETKEWVKTSLAPGSRVVENYLKKADLLDSLNTLGFNIV